MAMTTRQLANDFLAQKRLALVGVSHDPKDFTRQLFRDLQARGYDMVPVNPNLSEVEGQPCFARMQEIAPRVDGALVMTPPAATDGVVHDCAAAGVTRVWLHRGGGAGAVTPSAVKFCEEQAMQVVSGYCPYMFLRGAGFAHRVHAFFATRGMA